MFVEEKEIPLDKEEQLMIKKNVIPNQNLELHKGIINRYNRDIKQYNKSVEPTTRMIKYKEYEKYRNLPRINTNNLQERVLYSKIQDVVDLKNVEVKPDLEGFDNLKDKIKEDLEKFNQRFLNSMQKDLESVKKRMTKIDKIKYNNVVREIGNIREEGDLNKFKEQRKKINDNMVEDVRKKKLINIDFYSDKRIFIESFKTCMKSNMSEIYDKKIIDEYKMIDKTFVIKNNLKNVFQSLSKYEDKEFIKDVNNKENVIVNNSNKDKISKNNQLNIKESNSKIVKKGNLLNSNSSNQIDTSSSVREKSRSFLAKLKDILIRILTYLFQNNIRVDVIMEKNPFAQGPLSREKSYLYFESIKTNNTRGLSILLSQDPSLVFDFDFIGQTGYHWCAKRNNWECLNILISYGCHVNLYDNFRRTPLFLAASNSQEDTMRILMNNEANPFIKDSSGKTAMDVIEHPRLKRLLLDHCERVSYMNNKNYFKQRVLAHHKKTMLQLFSKKKKIKLIED